MWREEDRVIGSRYFVPEQLLSQEVERLLSTIREAKVQLPRNEPSVCFVLCRHLQGFGMYPLDAESKKAVYGRVIEAMRADASARVDVAAVIHNWNEPDLLSADGESLLKPKLLQAFRTCWFPPGQVDAPVGDRPVVCRT
jgi:hypothetical protein